MGLKNVTDIAVGDTITDFKNKTKEPIAGFEPAKPFVFAGIYPIDTDRFEDLRDALEKLKLNDSSLNFEPETSVALGFGFRVGFFGAFAYGGNQRAFGARVWIGFDSHSSYGNL